MLMTILFTLCTAITQFKAYNSTFGNAVNAVVGAGVKLDGQIADLPVKYIVLYPVVYASHDAHIVLLCFTYLCLFVCIFICVHVLQIVECIAESLSILETPIPLKVTFTNCLALCSFCDICVAFVTNSSQMYSPWVRHVVA